MPHLMVHKARQPAPEHMLVGGRRGLFFTPWRFDDRPLSERFQSWSYIAVNRNATAIANLPLRIFTDERRASSTAKALNVHRRVFLDKASSYQTSEKTVEDVDHPFLSVCRNPNPLLTRIGLHWLTAAFLQLKANAYWYVVFNQLGEPLQLWPLPAHRMWPVLGGNVIDHYELRYGNTAPILFDPDEIVHFQLPSPLEPLEGYAPADGVRSAIETNARYREYEHALLENMGVPDILVTPKTDKGQTTTERMSQLVSGWGQHFSGWRKRGKVGGYPVPLEVQHLGNTNVDMQFAEGAKYIMTEVLAGYGLPESLAKTDGTTFANMATGLRVWAEFTLNPLACVIAETLNVKIMPLYGLRSDGDARSAHDRPICWAAFDDASPDDDKLVADIQQIKIAAGVLTPDEARSNDGYDPLPDGLGAKPRFAVELELQQRAQLAALELGRAAAGAELEARIASGAEGGRADESIAAPEPVMFSDITAALDVALRNSDAALANLLRDEIAARLGRVAPPDVKSPPEPEPEPSAGDNDNREIKAVAGVAGKADEDSAATPAAAPFLPRTRLENAVLTLMSPVLPAAVAAKMSLSKIERGVRDGEFTAALAVHFEHEQKQITARLARIADAFKAVKAPADVRKLVATIFHRKQAGQALRAVGFEFLETAFKWGAQLGLDDLADIWTAAGVSGAEEAAEDVFAARRASAVIPAEAIEPEVARLVDEFASSVVSTTGDELASAMRETFSEGGTVFDLSKKISLLYGEKRDKAADRIARTELSNALNGGAVRQWQQAGVARKQWLASIDACEFCRAVNGRTIEIDKAFVDKGMSLSGVDGGIRRMNYKAVKAPTLHPHCTCTLLAVLE